jgi:hypothetical protein
MSGTINAIDERTAQIFEIREYPGYLASFTKQEAEGAWKNGTRVIKNGCDPEGDLTKDGVAGTILGSMGNTVIGYGYFVEWDDKPLMPSLCVPQKLRLAHQQ